MEQQHNAAAGAGAEPFRDQRPAAPQMAAEAAAPGQPGAASARQAASQAARKAPAVAAAFGTSGGAAIVFHDYASI